MLNILQKNNMANILIIVTRYFGGILLGTGGLVRAYTDVLQKAIENSKKIQKINGLECTIFLDYAEYSEFQYYCKQNEIIISNVEYGEKIECRIEFEQAKKEKINKDFGAKTINFKKIYISKSI